MRRLLVLLALLSTPAWAVTPVIEAADITTSSNDTTETPFPVSHPAYVSGDLLIFNLSSDQNPTHTIPTTCPNGESTTTVVANQQAGAGGPTISVFYCVGDATISAGTLNVTPSATEQWSAAVIKVLSGEFDSGTPVQSNSGQTSSTDAADTTVASPAWTADATANGRVVVFAVADTDALSATPSGWTDRVNVSTTRLGLVVSTRDTANTSSESIASVAWTIAGDTNASIGYVVNEPSGGGGISIPVVQYHRMNNND